MQDNQGMSPLDWALGNVYGEGHIHTAHYLISRGCGSDKERGKLLCGECYLGNLDVVKELVEQHKVDPNSESVY